VRKERERKGRGKKDRATWGKFASWHRERWMPVTAAAAATVSNHYLLT